MDEFRLLNGKVINLREYGGLDDEDRMDLLRDIKRHINKYGDSDDLRGLAHEICIHFHDLGLYDKIHVED